MKPVDNDESFCVVIKDLIVVCLYYTLIQHW